MEGHADSENAEMEQLHGNSPGIESSPSSPSETSSDNQCGSGHGRGLGTGRDIRCGTGRDIGCGRGGGSDGGRGRGRGLLGDVVGVVVGDVEGEVGVMWQLMELQKRRDGQGLVTCRFSHFLGMSDLPSPWKKTLQQYS